MNLSYKKILPIALAFNMSLMATLPSLAMTRNSQAVFSAAEYKKKTESLKKELYSKHGKKISSLIEKIRVKIDKAIDAIVLEVKADQSRQNISKEQLPRNSSEFVSDYFNRHRADFKDTELGSVLYKSVPSVLSQLNLEEQFVFKSLLADMIENKDYGKQYDRYEVAIGAGVGLAIGFIFYATQIYSGKMANALEDSIAGIFVMLMATTIGLIVGDKFTLGVDAQQKAQQVQNQLKSELSSLRSDADSILEELVRSQFYPETLN